ncbi:MAG: WD40 repeat domain-containing protein [Leptonema illini]|uniref:WD40 repeat domain-containing protein n=1 Tax=Leptonema illini TaxID=183 RepID=A0A833H046_9LEPT|nr:MAG: WD40 repeat domain-containing protein [Leptonema illini]
MNKLPLLLALLSAFLSCADPHANLRSHAIRPAADGYASPAMLGMALYRNESTWERSFGNCTLLFSWIPFAYCAHPAVAFSQSGQTIAITTVSPVHTSVSVYDVATARLLWKKSWGHFLGYGVPESLSFSTADNQLQAVTDHDLRTFDASDGILMHTQRHSPNFYVVAVEDFLYLGHRGSVSKLTLNQFALVRTYDCSRAPVTRIALSKDRAKLAVTDEAGTVCVFDNETGSLRWKRSLSPDWTPALAAFDPISSDLYIATNHNIHVFPAADQSREQTIPCDVQVFDIKSDSHNLHLLGRRVWDREPALRSMQLPLNSTSCSLAESSEN